jgi:hypothetical protein
MNLIKYIKNLKQFPNNTRNTIDKVRALTKELNKLTNDINVIKNDLNIIFRYMSGLELHPKMSERLIVNDYRDVSKDHLVRYLKACEYIKSSDKVLDIACGCGYGS